MSQTGRPARRWTNPLAAHVADWTTLGRIDPLWAILTERSKRGRRWEIGQFLATGAPEVAAILAKATGLGRPRHRRTALDFGCGVGRLTVPLADAFQRTVGIDIAAPMLEQARKLAGPRDDIELVQVDPTAPLPYPDGAFDLVLSIHVLQHLPARDHALAQLRELARVTADDGLLVVQLAGPIPLRHRLQLRRRAFAALRRLGLGERTLFDRLGLSPMRLIGFDRPVVRAALEREGLDILAIGASRLAGSRMRSFTYYAAKGPP